MSRVHWLSLVCSAFAVLFCFNSLQAASIGGPSSVLTGAAAATDFVQKVHGCHRLGARDRWGWHRHGIHCRRIW